MLTCFKSLWNWFTGKNDKKQLEELKETLPDEPISKEPPPPIKKGSLEDIRDFCDEVRKDLWIKKKTDDRLYVEFGNLKDKIEQLLEGKK